MNGKKKKLLTAALCIAVLATGLYVFAMNYTGWAGIKGTDTYYYVDKGRVVKDAWVTDKKGKYHLDPEGRFQTGLQKIGDKYFWFDDEGLQQTGWYDDGDRKMYFISRGWAAVGWKNIDGRSYYFEKDGSMHKGWLKSAGKTYYFDSHGECVDGWQTIDKNTYYFRDSAMQTGWIKDGDKTFYLDKEGRMVKGEQKIGDKYYLFSDKGFMKKGWNDNGNGKRYYGEKGFAVTGWNTIEGSLYYFDEEGCMQTGTIDTEEGRFFVDEDGTVNRGWHDDGSFYVCSDGYVIDRDTETGDYGRLFIRECRIDTALYMPGLRTDYQDVVDKEDSAVVVKERRDTEAVIADRRSQGFVLDNVKEGVTAYMLSPDKEMTEYSCSRKVTGKNTGDDIVDDEGKSVWDVNEDGFCAYASTGKGDGSVIITYWIPSGQG